MGAAGGGGCGTLKLLLAAGADPDMRDVPSPEHVHPGQKTGLTENSLRSEISVGMII